ANRCASNFLRVRPATSHGGGPTPSGRHYGVGSMVQSRSCQQPRNARRCPPTRSATTEWHTNSLVAQEYSHPNLRLITVVMVNSLRRTPQRCVIWAARAREVLGRCRPPGSAVLGSAPAW